MKIFSPTRMGHRNNIQKNNILWLLIDVVTSTFISGSPYTLDKP